MTKTHFHRLFVAFLIGLFSLSAFAKPVPRNLGGGLDVVYTDFLIQQGQVAAGADRPAISTAAAGYLDGAYQDGSGRVRVTVYLNGDQTLASVVSKLTASGFQVVGSSSRYRHGVVDGWLSIADSAKVAQLRGVSSVVMEARPVTNVGLTTQQGVVQHRVDQIGGGIDGTGITIGVLSDTYNFSNNPIKPVNDVASCDLPGAANPCGNTQDVVIVEEWVPPVTIPPTVGIDEGRAMLQLIHDIAPKARLGFATAFSSALGFAENIRALANLPGAPRAVPGFTADIIVDDVIYLTEPMFSDGIVAQAVNDVTAAGKHYFSSAGNRPSTLGYAANFSFVSPAPGAETGSGVNLTGVPAALYAGGFHNFNLSGQDISQTIRRTAGSGANARLVLQWDDPFDKTITGTESFTASADFTGTPASMDFFIPMTAGIPMRVVAAQDGSSFDPIVTITDPSSTIIVNQQDDGFNETMFFTPTQTGTYKVTIEAYNSTIGLFTVKAFENSGVGVTTDYNLLFFRGDTGAFISAISAGGPGTNQAVEFGSIPFQTGLATVHMVIARGSTTGNLANRLRYVIFDGSQATARPDDYISYQYPVTYGHNSSRDGHGVAAFSAFRPYIPESFSSPGPVTIMFDANGDRLPEPEMRQQPVISAMDGANNTFFSSDSQGDPDRFSNFFGTSAAAPNAAAIAGLVLQAKGGPGSVSVAQMKQLLINSAMPNDLDPYFAKAEIPTSGGTLTITLNADHTNSSAVTGPPSSLPLIDPNVFNVSYAGTGSVASLLINGGTGNTTGGTVNGAVRGMVFDTRTQALNGLPFTLGTLNGLLAGDITPSNVDQAPTPAQAGVFYGLGLAFGPGAFTGGKSFGFNVDRDEFAVSALPFGAFQPQIGNSADLFGATNSIPEAAVVPGGVKVSGTMADGSVFNGVFVNRVGAGYSPLSGYGFLNAQRAVALATTTTAASVILEGNGTGTVTSAPGPVNCPGTCSGDFTTGAPVTFTATPTGDSVLVSFTGCDSQVANTCTISPTLPRSIVANFASPGSLPPPMPTATALRGNASATIYVNTTASPVTGFSATCDNGAGTQNGMSPSFTFTGLTNGTMYSCTVSVNNAAGSSPSSSPVTVTPATVPTAPTIGAATGVPGTATVTFTTPNSDGGSPITGYRVTTSPGNALTFGVSSPILVPITAGSTNTFTVSAFNEAGNSVNSAASNAVGPPGVPTAVVGTVVGSGSVSVAFTAPAANGSAITSYLVSSNTGGFTATGGSSPIVVSGLVNGTSYTFTVRATNGLGQGVASAASNTATPSTVPGIPTIGTATAGNAQASVSFTAPGNNGGSPITGYTVTSTPGSVTATGPASPLVVTGLTNGQGYTFTVRATNANGDSLESGASNSVTPSGAPPPGLRPRDADGSGTSDVFWTDPNGQAALWLMNGTSITGSALILGPTTGWTMMFVTGDFNGDGRADILWRHTSGMWAMWTLNGTAVVDSGLLLGPGNWDATHVADFDGDGRTDILWKNTDGSVSMWLMNGLTVLNSSIIFGPNAAWTVTKAADLNNDTRADLVWRNTDGSVAAWLMNGINAIDSALIFGSGTTWEVSQVGDYDGNGTKDLLFKDAGNQISIWLMNGLAPTITALVYDGTGGFVPTHTGDFNGDGRDDVLLKDAGGQVTVALLNGVTIMENTIVFGGGGGWVVTHVGDYDGDGNSDLLWKDAGGQVAIWTMSGSSVLTSLVIFGGNGGWVASP